MTRCIATVIAWLCAAALLGCAPTVAIEEPVEGRRYGLHFTVEGMASDARFVIVTVTGENTEGILPVSVVSRVAGDGDWTFDQTVLDGEGQKLRGAAVAVARAYEEEEGELVVVDEDEVSFFLDR